MSILQSDRGHQCLVELAHGERWVRLVLSLAEPCSGSGRVAFAPDARFAVEPADEFAGTYQRENWMSGIMSGIYYVFRALSIPRRPVWISELAGKVGSDDTVILAQAAGIAVARLSGKDPPQLELGGWTVVRAEILGQQSEDARGREAVA